METKVALARRLDTRIDSLLDSLIRSFEILSPLAVRIFDAELLPCALERFVEENGSDGSWCCWQDRHQLWFYTVQMSPIQLLERGDPVLHVSRLDWDGEMLETGWWIRVERWRPLPLTKTYV